MKMDVVGRETGQRLQRDDGLGETPRLRVREGEIAARLEMLGPQAYRLREGIPSALPITHGDQGVAELEVHFRRQWARRGRVAKRGGGQARGSQRLQQPAKAIVEGRPQTKASLLTRFGSCARSSA